MLRLDPRPDEATLVALQSGGAAERAALEVGNASPDHAVVLAARLRHGGFPVSGGRLLDVGCGGGDLLAALAERLQARGTGIDACEEAISVAQGRFPGLAWVSGSLESGALGGEAFDAVTLVHVLEHVPAPLALLRAIRSRLRPGGLLAIDVPNGEFHFGPAGVLLEAPKPLVAAILQALGRRVPFTSRGFYPYHLSLFGPGTLAAMVRAAGFEVIEAGVATERLARSVRDAHRPRQWPRLALNAFKLGLARCGYGDTLRVLARAEAPGRSVDQ